MPPDDSDGLVRRELRRLAELEPSSGRQARAKATALRALLRLEGRGGRVLTEAEEHLWDPDRRQDELIDEDDWHPSRDTGFFELDSATRSVNAGAGGWLSTATDAGKPRSARSA
jgi:hypothetical protein